MSTPVYGIAAQIRDLLINNAPLQAEISGRVHPGIVPQKSVFPCVVLTQISSERTPVMGEDTGTVRSTWQIDQYATTYAQARKVASLVRKALERRAGTFPAGGSPVIAPRLIQAIFVEADTDLFEDETQLHRVSTDYTIWYQEEGE
jgi:hypothetical protein